MAYTPAQVRRVSEFLQAHMKRTGIAEMVADECARLLARNGVAVS